MKHIFAFLVLLITSVSIGQTVIWSEDFEGPNTDWTLNISTGTNGVDANEWRIDDDENGHTDGQCGSGNAGNNSLYLGCQGGWCFGTGAAYNAGGLTGFAFPETNTRAAYNQAISTVGQTNLTLSFHYIAGGQAGADFGALEYSTDGGTTWTNLLTPAITVICGSGQGEWDLATINLPATFENLADLRFAFHWTNNDDGVGADPSFAVNDISLTVPSTGGPTADFSASETNICLNDCIDFTDLSTGTNVNAWSWDFGNGATSTDQNPTSICYTTAGNYTVTLTVTDDNGNDTETKTNYITVNTPPTITASAAPGITVCDGEQVTLTGAGAGAGGSYAWNNGVTDGTAFTPPAGTTTTYTVTGTDANTCTNTTTIDITSNAGPSVTANASPGIAICNGDPVTLTGSGTATSYTWDNGVTDGVAFNPAATATYTVTGTDANMCTTTDQITITVNNCSVPTADFTASQTNLCEGDCIDFTDASTGTNISAWDWDFGNGMTSTDQNPTNICFATAGTYTITLTITDDNGTDTETKVDYIVVTACSAPVADFNVSNTNPCIGDAIDFTDNSVGTNVSSWSWDFGGGATPNTSNVQNPTGIVFNTPGSYTITLTITDDNGTDQTTQSITVIDCQTPVADFTFDTNICLGDCIDFTDASTGNPTTYAWDFGGGATPNTSTAANPSSICFNTIGNYTISLTVTNASGTDVITYNLAVNDVPTIVAAGDTVIDVGGTAVLEATSSAGDLIWSPSNSLDCDDCTIVNASPETNTNYIVTIVDANGCTDQDTVSVIVNLIEGIGVPSAFSPDGVGMNDLLYVKGFGISSMEFKVYNRYGQKVFETTDQSIGWDGTVNGKPENQGVFVYVLKYSLINNQEGTLKGNVTLVR